MCAHVLYTNTIKDLQLLKHISRYAIRSNNCNNFQEANLARKDTAYFG